MSALRAFLVDDEPLARERLRQFLAREPGVTVIGECGDGPAALRQVPEARPDLLFLDVQMPGPTGFEVLAALGQDAPPAVIFTTAFDQYAVRAFEVHAVDYLLKPIDRERLHQAVERAACRLQSGGDDPLQTRLQAMLEEIRPARAPDRLAIKSSGRVVFVQVADIDWVGSADNYVEIHAGGRAHLLRETMNRLAGRLPPETFIRISRTALINVGRLKEVRPLFHGEYAVVLQDGTKLTLSRSYRDQLARLGVK
ncbi:MAG: LytR/AlgR family response regulator transcription factor [Verrucomicrobiota bacterium]